MRREITLVIMQLSTGFIRYNKVSYTPEQIEKAYKRLNRPEGDYKLLNIVDDER